ncbi:hypothetical protein [Wolbachia endosymbiont of Pentidionis agamae]
MQKIHESKIGRRKRTKEKRKRACKLESNRKKYDWLVKKVIANKCRSR